MPYINMPAFYFIFMEEEKSFKFHIELKQKH